MRGFDKDNGVISRDWLRKKLYEAISHNRCITVHTIKDKRCNEGRLLVELVLEDEDISLNGQLVALGLALEYVRG